MFSQSNNSLKLIKGISTPHDGTKQLGYPISFWKGRNWTAFRAFTQRYTGKDLLQGSFPIDYKTGAKTFPFAEYIKNVCPPPSGVMVTYETGYRCSSRSRLDIGTEQFSNTQKKQQFQDTFNHHGETRCYAKDNKNQWRKVDCNSSATHST